jgi:hypothetical protein
MSRVSVYGCAVGVTIGSGDVVVSCRSVAIVMFCAGVENESWNCIRITKYVVTAPTICNTDIYVQNSFQREQNISLQLYHVGSY